MKFNNKKKITKLNKKPEVKPSIDWLAEAIVFFFSVWFLMVVKMRSILNEYSYSIYNLLFLGDFLSNSLISRFQSYWN